MDDIRDEQVMQDIINAGIPEQVQQPDFIEEQPQEPDFIPETQPESLLQNAIKYAGGGLKAFIPQNKEEWSDMPRIGLNVVGNLSGANTPLMTNPLAGPMEIGSKMFGLGKDQPFETGIKDAYTKITTPKTEWGKEEAKFLNQASTIPFLAIAGKRLAGMGLDKIFNVNAARGKVGGLVRTGTEDATIAQEQVQQAGNRFFGNDIQSIQDTGIRETHLRDWLGQIARELDASGSTWGDPNSIAGRVLALRNDQRLFQGGMQNLTGPQLQEKIVQIKNLLGELGAAPQGAFTPIMEQGMAQVAQATPFREAQQALSGFHQQAQAIDPLTRAGTLRNIASGTIDKPYLQQLQGVEREAPGLNIIQNLIKAGKNVRGAQTANKVGKVLTNTAAVGIPGLMGLNRLLEAIRGQ